jgi:hypothetical protein
LSQEKLLHLAAFCISKVVNVVHENGDSRRNGQKADAALDAVRRLAVLCETVNPTSARREPITIVNGLSDDERQNQERLAMTSGSPMLVDQSTVRSPWWWAVTGSVVYAVAERLGIRRKTPRN